MAAAYAVTNRALLPRDLGSEPRLHPNARTRLGADGFRLGDRRELSPEQEGCFVCLDHREKDWFVDMNNTGGRSMSGRSMVLASMS